MRKVLFVLVFGISIVFASCQEKKSKWEKAGEHLENAADEAADAVEETAEEGAEKSEDGAHKAKKKIKKLFD